jgi:ABC-type multidrug transport system fused ATPase/permease subunit
MSWWGFVLSITALMLAVPLAVIGNLITPRIQQWWSQRSVTALRRRVDQLKADLADLEVANPPLSDFEDYVLRALLGLFWLAFATAVSVGIVVVFPDVYPIGFLKKDVLEKYMVYPQATETMLFVASLSVLIAGVATYFFVVRPLFAFHRKRSRRVRESMRKAIERLSRKLSTMT